MLFRVENFIHAANANFRPLDHVLKVLGVPKNPHFQWFPTKWDIFMGHKVVLINDDKIP